MAPFGVIDQVRKEGELLLICLRVLLGLCVLERQTAERSIDLLVSPHQVNKPRLKDIEVFESDKQAFKGHLEMFLNFLEPVGLFSDVVRIVARVDDLEDI